MKLDKLSMQFSTQETEPVGDVLEAYERLILDAMRGDHTLFTTAEGIESLWERSTPCWTTRRRPSSIAGHVGTQRGHQLIAPERVAAAVRAGVARGQELSRWPDQAVNRTTARSGESRCTSVKPERRNGSSTPVKRLRVALSMVGSTGYASSVRLSRRATFVAAEISAVMTPARHSRAGT